MRRRRVPYKAIYLFSCFVFLSFGLISTGFAQTSDEVLYGQIQTAQIQEKEEPRFGANDLQANVIIVAGDSVFIDAGRVAGLERSDYLSGQITRRTHSGEEVIGNFAILEVGGEVSQVVVIPVFGKTVQLGDRAVFGTYTAQAQEPNLQNMHVNNEFKNSLGNLFADTDPNAGRAIGLANTGLANAATPEAFQENVAVSTSAGGLISSRAYNASNAQVNKSSVIPTGSAASLLAGAISSAAAQNAATGAPLYCSDPRFADREACQGPVPLMGQSSVSSVTPTTTTMSTANSNSVTATRPASALPATALPTTMTVNANIPVTSSVPVPAYCSSQAYSSRPECTVSPVSTNQTPQASASQPGYCTDSRYATRPECMTSATTTTATVSNAPAYCATPANQSRPECMATSQPASQLASQLASQAHQGSHISTASAAPQNTVAGSALSIDPYTGQPYTTSYQGYSGDEATPLVHTAAQSQARQATQAQAAQQAQSPIQSRSRVVSGVVSSIPYGTGSSSARTVTNVDVPAYIGPATIANQTIAIPVLPNTTPYYAPNTTENTQVTSAPQTSTSYTTVQTYYDSNWGDEWDPSYVNTTPSSTGIIPANAPAPYYLRVARVKNNLGFPNEAINILEMGLAQYPNDVSLNSEMTMIYTMLTQGNMGDFCPEESSIAPDPVTTVSASADMCEEEVVEEYHEHDDHHHDDDHSHDDNHHHSHGDYDHEHGHEHSHEHDADYGSSGSSQYANDHLENVQITTRYNAPTRDARQQNSRQQSAGQNGPYRLENEEDMVNQSYAAQVQNRGATPQMSAASPMANQNMVNQNMVNQSYAAQNQNKPAFNSPIGMASGTGMYDSEKGGIVRPRWNTDK